MHNQQPTPPLRVTKPSAATFPSRSYRGIVDF